MEDQETKLKRVAIYVRVSTIGKSLYNSGLEFDQRPEVQVEPLRQLAEQRGWEVVKVYSDRLSGKEESRPGLNEMLSDARRGQFELLLVWRFDRLSRSASHLLQVIAELERLGVDFVSHQEALDTSTPMGRFVLTMFGALAELERSVIRERVKAGLEHAKRFGTKSGKPIGRPKRVFDRDQVVLLRSQGLSWPAIARRLHLGVGTVVRVYQERERQTAPCQNPIV